MEGGRDRKGRAVFYFKSHYLKLMRPDNPHLQVRSGLLRIFCPTV